MKVVLSVLFPSAREKNWYLARAYSHANSLKNLRVWHNIVDVSCLNSVNLNSPIDFNCAELGETSAIRENVQIILFLQLVRIIPHSLMHPSFGAN